jgi:hypothetical protein
LREFDEVERKIAGPVDETALSSQGGHQQTLAQKKGKTF